MSGTLTDHPLRYDLANELHARPFPVMRAPGHAVFLAIRPPGDAAARDRGADRAHLVALLDRFGAAHPREGATHFFGDLGRHKIKWECHTEFVTYTVFSEGLPPVPFDGSAFGVFPEDWLAEAPGERLTSVLVRVEMGENEAAIPERLGDWFDGASVAVSRVLDASAIVASDFRIDSRGHMRVAIFANPDTGPRRLGRVVQRLLEVETYKTIAMLGLPMAREVSARLTEIDSKLAALVAAMNRKEAASDATLTELLDISAEVESMLARHAFRFGATFAYEAIVNQRITVLREERFQGRQTFEEFMTRRFDPAMRTVRATEGRLERIAERARQAGSLLRTRVDVERSAENQALLASMDRRADLQLRLQRTVEGLSVVAISYYAVNLAVYMTEPLADEAGLPKLWLTAGLTPLVVLAVWGVVRRIRRMVVH
ncbi:MAG: DUF3422 domain-containing protein [Rhodobacteraceae bacterium]|nr:DUF3422 domain-containing protein [Paracoccaceae bacterium]